VAALVDTNVLVYRFDHRFPRKQRIATDLLRRGIEESSVWVPHQAIVEFVAVLTRPLGHDPPLLPRESAYREAEDLMNQFELLFPNASVVRLALRGAATYDLAWFDAHLWAYAEFCGLNELLSEDFQDGRFYGTVKAINPFRT
jgi:predicted nucleic acid-binding protein